MKIGIHGAGNEVTGSAYLLESEKARVLVDCGAFQGGRKDELRNVIPRPMAKALNAIILTHGHLDHVGRLPLLIKKGYAGPVYATPATIEVAQLILKDSAKIMKSEAERINRKRERARQPLIEPMFEEEDVDRTMKLMRPLQYDGPAPVAPGIKARMHDSGHILGSAIVELFVEDGGREKRVVFSGDLGPVGMPILKDAARIDHADWVFMESTYGDRDHRPLDATVAEFYDILRDSRKSNGKILIPTFAIGRTQEMLYFIAKAFHQKLVAPFPVYLDSPMGIAATELYARHTELYDQEMAAFSGNGDMKEALRTLQISESADDSKALNDVKGSCLIMAGSGMCTAGRILHHLKHNLWRPETTVVIVGYQAPGSLGRALVDGKPEVSIFGEKIAVAAKVRTLGGFSAHAGQSDLLKWYSSIAPKRPRTVLVHGEERGRKPLARLIKERWGIEAELPFTGDTLAD